MTTPPGYTRDTKTGDMTRWACHGRARSDQQTQCGIVQSLVWNVNVDMERLTANGILGIWIELTAITKAPIHFP